MWLSWVIFGATFLFMVVLQSRGKDSNSYLQSFEARISDCNLCYCIKMYSYSYLYCHKRVSLSLEHLKVLIDNHIHRIRSKCLINKCERLYKVIWWNSFTLNNRHVVAGAFLKTNFLVIHLLFTWLTHAYTVRTREFKLWQKAFLMSISLLLHDLFKKYGKVKWGCG